MLFHVLWESASGPYLPQPPSCDAMTSMHSSRFSRASPQRNASEIVQKIESFECNASEKLDYRFIRRRSIRLILFDVFHKLSFKNENNFHGKFLFLLLSERTNAIIISAANRTATATAIHSLSQVEEIIRQFVNTSNAACHFPLPRMEQCSISDNAILLIGEISFAIADRQQTIQTHHNG